MSVVLAEIHCLSRSLDAGIVLRRRVEQAAIIAAESSFSAPARSADGGASIDRPNRLQVESTIVLLNHPSFPNDAPASPVALLPTLVGGVVAGCLLLAFPVETYAKMIPGCSRCTKVGSKMDDKEAELEVRTLGWAVQLIQCCGECL